MQVASFLFERNEDLQSKFEENGVSLQNYMAEARDHEERNQQVMDELIQKSQRLAATEALN